MRSRLMCVGAVVAVFLGVVGFPTSSARADTTADITFVGTVVLGGGLGYPVETLPITDTFPLNTPEPNVLLGGNATTTLDHALASVNAFIAWATTAGIDLDCSLPLNGSVTGAIPNCHPVYDHLRPILAIFTTVCVAEGTNVLKSDKLPVFAGSCLITLIDTPKPNPPENTVSGHCGMNGGQMSWVITMTNAFDGTMQLFLVDVHFINGLLIGHYTKVGDPSNHGLLVGVFHAPPNPAGGSCLNKTATIFEMVADLLLIPEPLL